MPGGVLAHRPHGCPAYFLIPAQIPSLLARGAAKRLHLERLSGYAPDLNPDEGIWNHLKRVELKNRCCADLAELCLELRRAKERLRHKRHIIRRFSAHCGYSI